MTLKFALTMVVMLLTHQALQAQGYKVLSAVKVGGDGAFDYVYADNAARKLYIPRMGAGGHIAVFDLDTLKPVGEIANASAHGVAIDEKTQHGFGSSKPVVMWDTATLATIKTIEAQGGPDGITEEPLMGRVYVFSHSAPNVTVIDAKDGSIAGTIDLGGAPEQAVSDGAGHVYVDLEDKGSIAVIDAKTLKVTGTYDLKGKGDGCAGLTMDTANGILFATCREPQTMVMVKASDGTILDTLPIGAGTDGVVFNPKTMEAFSSNGDGTLTVVKEQSPTSFKVEQTLKTMPRAKTITLDTKTGHLLLISAEFAPPAANAPAANGRPARGVMVPGTFSIIIVGK
jgi:glutamine cyclotransferase